MRPTFFASLLPSRAALLALAALAALSACETDSPTSTATDVATQDLGGGDTGAGDASSGDSAGSDTGAVDTLAGDATAAADIQGGDSSDDADSGASDAAIHDASGEDGGVKDASSSDAVKTDGSSADVAKDVQPTKCSADADCPKGFGDCQISGCDTATGKCFTKIAADGASCKVAGVCGGTGTCAMGACEVAGNPCKPQDCAPKPLKCGDSLTIEASKLGASAYNVWPCTGAKLEGGEAVYSLAAEATGVAAVSLSGAGTDAALLMLIANPAANPGQCSSLSCAKAGASLSLGMKAGLVHTLVVDTTAGLDATLKLTVTCGPAPSCGDGTCSGNESCGGCPKDCGTCPTCGDGSCNPKTENCASCQADCGECKLATGPECTAKTTPGCPGCACEATVCKEDDYCCDTAWDSICVDLCTDAGGPMCTKPDACGDNDCGDNEFPSTCPQDCGDPVGCGDGKCASSETCTSCPLDCGACPPAQQAVCGNGKCDTSEHCGTCPKDCGICSTDCSALTSKNTPGCPGCACEAEVCKADPYCCATAWDSLCVSACAKSAQMACPKNVCGDGVCSGSEGCENCSKDCGACVCGDGKCQSSENDTSCVPDCVKCGDNKCSPSENSAGCPADCPVCGDGVCAPKETISACPADCIKCGDGICSAPTETLQSCEADCSVGCKGKCGKSASDGKGGTCYCDAQCASFGDCCADKKTYCP